MTITSEIRDDIAVLTLSGKLVFDESLSTLRNHVQPLLQSNIKRFIIDFSALSHCDSSGCGEVIGVYASIRKAGGAVAFLRPNDRVRLLWTRIRLMDVFNVFETLAEAEAFVRR